MKKLKPLGMVLGQQPKKNNRRVIIKNTYNKGYPAKDGLIFLCSMMRSTHAKTIPFPASSLLYQCTSVRVIIRILANKGYPAKGGLTFLRSMMRLTQVDQRNNYDAYPVQQQ